jgi:mycothiol system anti-sigma-R factor
VLRQIELYLDGELVGLERVELEHHLGGCSNCYDHTEFQRRLKQMLRAKCGCDEVPTELAERVRALFAYEPEPPH